MLCNFSVYFVSFQCVASKIGLPSQYLYYFGMYLVCKDPDADYSSMLVFFMHFLNDHFTFVHSASRCRDNDVC